MLPARAGLKPLTLSGKACMSYSQQHKVKIMIFLAGCGLVYSHLTVVLEKSNKYTALRCFDNLKQLVLLFYFSFFVLIVLICQEGLRCHQTSFSFLGDALGQILMLSPCSNARKDIGIWP